mmetsp:Transcript_64541/g.187029  ORF Transcript_64541/g.187029 Transcript_64541/m.187029 type:complete len:289 (-) Transcript_64541:649-1515(-)
MVCKLLRCAFALGHSPFLALGGRDADRWPTGLHGILVRPGLFSEATPGVQVCVCVRFERAHRRGHRRIRLPFLGIVVPAEASELLARLAPRLALGERDAGTGPSARAPLPFVVRRGAGSGRGGVGSESGEAFTAHGQLPVNEPVASGVAGRRSLPRASTSFACFGEEGVGIARCTLAAWPSRTAGRLRCLPHGLIDVRVRVRLCLRLSLVGRRRRSRTGRAFVPGLPLEGLQGRHLVVVLGPFCLKDVRGRFRRRVLGQGNPPLRVHVVLLAVVGAVGSMPLPRVRSR